MGIPSMLPMVAFIVAIFLVLKQPTVRIPFTTRYLGIDYGLAPFIGVLILLVTRSMGLATLERSILGGPHLKPYSIIILIMSLSYICVSLDYTGLFEYLSLRVVRAFGTSSGRLFASLSLLTAFLTLFTNNDIVILTMTLIIFYVCKNARLDPIPFLFTQFFIVNIFGMALYIGNPTNIVAADVYGLSFLGFARWMFLPSLSAAASCLLLFWLMFRRRMRRKPRLPRIDPQLALRDKKGAIFGSAVLACTIFLMSMSTSVPLWTITLLFAIVAFLHDLISHRSRISSILSRVPWKIAPFLVGLFILIEGLASAGWTDLFASNLSKLSGGLATTVFGTCFLSSFLAAIMNNHPMTIFFVKSFQSPSFVVDRNIRLSSTLALIAGSNFGANLTLIGALAGLMWAKILSDKGRPISFAEFSKYGLLIMPLVIAVACSTLLVELMLWS